jgi:hypothetical protein
MHRCGSLEALRLGILARSTGTEGGDGAAHQLAALSISAAASVKALNIVLTINVEPAS